MQSSFRVDLSSF